MTEDEAKTKWCPFARVLDGVSHEGGNCAAAINRTNGFNCIGMQCMAWIALQIPVVQNIKTKEIRHIEQGEGYNGSTERLVYRDSVVDGYCGLARKP